MIINPSAHTMIPRRNSFRNRAIGRRRQALSIPGGKELWLGISKVLFAAFVFLCIVSFILDGSIARVSGKIEQVEVAHSELVGTNILLRTQKARLFSSEEIGVLADNQLAIHIPATGQYLKF